MKERLITGLDIGTSFVRVVTGQFNPQDGNFYIIGCSKFNILHRGYGQEIKENVLATKLTFTKTISNPTATITIDNTAVLVLIE